MRRLYQKLVFSSNRLKRVFQILAEIGRIFEADGKAQHPRRDTKCRAVGRFYALMRRRLRMGYEALAVAKIVGHVD